MNTGIAKLITFGLGGHRIDVDAGPGTGSGSISGYDTPEQFEQALARGGEPWYPPLAGVPVVDKRAVLAERPGLAVRSPMCSARLAPGQVRRFADLCPDPAASLLVRALAQGDGQQRALAALAVAAATSDYGGLDEVAPDLYLAWWQAHGARIGRMDETGTRIVWQDGE